MKTLITKFLLLGSLTATAAAEPCALDYLKFCEHQDPRVPNMCPQVLGVHLQKTCVVTEAQAAVIEKSCASEIKEICRSSTGDEFLLRYVCLTNPEKWEKFKPECLQSLVKGNPHH